MFLVITLLFSSSAIKLHHREVIRLQDKNYYDHKIHNNNNHVSFI